MNTEPTDFRFPVDGDPAKKKLPEAEAIAYWKKLIAESDIDWSHFTAPLPKERERLE